MTRSDIYLLSTKLFQQRLCVVDNLEEVVPASLPSRDPLGGIQRALGEDTPVAGAVGQRQRLVAAGDQHLVFAGDIAGEHEVLLGGNNETLSLTHRAGDRSIFAEGALDAAEWLAGREAGWYDFFEVIEG